MKNLFLSLLTALAIMTTTMGPIPVIGQQVSTPFETRLLNGLKLVVFKTQQEDVTVRLRIHVGSSFDMAGKEGTIKLLTEILFPSDELRAFIKEDFGSDLRLITNYDFIEIQTGAKKDRIISLLETLAARLSNPEINAETTEAAKRLLNANNLESLQGRLTQEAATLHLGSYPHGRSINGTRESLARIDFADITQARARFLSPDNATLVISGDVDEGLMSRAARRLFGPWTRADQKPRWAFATPQKNESTENVFQREGIPDGVQEYRLAVRNFARSDARFSSYRVVLSVLRTRLQARFDVVSLEDRGHRIPGVLVLGGSSRKPDSKEFLLTDLLQDLTESEFEVAKRSLVASSQPLIERYLDAETYGFTSPEQESVSLSRLTLEDINSTLRSLREAPRSLLVFRGTGESGETVK